MNRCRGKPINKIDGHSRIVQSMWSRQQGAQLILSLHKQRLNSNLHQRYSRASRSRETNASRLPVILPPSVRTQPHPHAPARGHGVRLQPWDSISASMCPCLTEGEYHWLHVSVFLFWCFKPLTHQEFNLQRADKVSCWIEWSARFL